MSLFKAIKIDGYASIGYDFGDECGEIDDIWTTDFIELEAKNIQEAELTLKKIKGGEDWQWLVFPADQEFKKEELKVYKVYKSASGTNRQFNPFNDIKWDPIYYIGEEIVDSTPTNISPVIKASFNEKKKLLTIKFIKQGVNTDKSTLSRQIRDLVREEVKKIKDQYVLEEVEVVTKSKVLKKKV